MRIDNVSVEDEKAVADVTVTAVDFESMEMDTLGGVEGVKDFFTAEEAAELKAKAANAAEYGGLMNIVVDAARTKMPAMIDAMVGKVGTTQKNGKILLEKTDGKWLVTDGVDALIPDVESLVS